MEHIPLIVLLLLVAELSGGNTIALHVFGGVLVVARLLHAVGLMQGKSAIQVPGAGLTYLLEASLPIYLLILRPWG